MKEENVNFNVPTQNEIFEEKKYKDIISNSNWNQKEDSYLNELVSYFGLSNINIVYQSFGLMFPDAKRTLEECSQRWKEINRKVRMMNEFSGAEELELLKFHMKYHNNWTVLVKKLGNRNGNQVKNHFYSTFRKIVRKILKNNYNYSKSRLEQLQALYIMNLIESYILKPHEMKALATNKKSKNHVHTLVNAIPFSVLQAYKEHFKNTFHVSEINDLIAEVEKSLVPTHIIELPVVNQIPHLNVNSLRTLPSPFNTFNFEKSFLENERLSIPEEEKPSFIKAITKDITSSYSLTSIRNCQSFNSSQCQENQRKEVSFGIASHSFA